jgi:hypothetical protein
MLLNAVKLLISLVFCIWHIVWKTASSSWQNIILITDLQTNLMNIMLHLLSLIKLKYCMHCDTLLNIELISQLCVFHQCAAANLLPGQVTSLLFASWMIFWWQQALLLSLTYLSKSSCSAFSTQSLLRMWKRILLVFKEQSLTSRIFLKKSNSY